MALELRTDGPCAAMASAKKVPITEGLTPEQEAEYSLDYGVSGAELVDSVHRPGVDEAPFASADDAGG